MYLHCGLVSFDPCGSRQACPLEKQRGKEQRVGSGSLWWWAPRSHREPHGLTQHHTYTVQCSSGLLQRRFPPPNTDSLALGCIVDILHIPQQRDTIHRLQRFGKVLKSLEYWQSCLPRPQLLYCGTFLSVYPVSAVPEASVVCGHYFSLGVSSELSDQLVTSVCILLCVCAMHFLFGWVKVVS